MADIDDARAYLISAGYSDWATTNPVVQQAMLVRADSYITTHYRLKSDLTDDETALVSLARWLIAYDLASNPTPLPLRRTANVERKTVQVAGVETSTQYAVGTGPIDPYPQITQMLTPIIVPYAVANYYSGWQS